MFTEQMKKDILALGTEKGVDLSPLFQEDTPEEEKQTLALAALCLQSQKDIEEGRSYSAEEVLANLREKRIDK